MNHIEIAKTISYERHLKMFLLIGNWRYPPWIYLRNLVLDLVEIFTGKTLHGDLEKLVKICILDKIYDLFRTKICYSINCTKISIYLVTCEENYF